MEIREDLGKKKRVWQVKRQIQSFMQPWRRQKTVATHQNNNSALQSLILILFILVGDTNCHIFNEEHLWFNFKALIKNACCILYLWNVWKVGQNTQNSFLFNLKQLNSRTRKSCSYLVQQKNGPGDNASKSPKLVIKKVRSNFQMLGVLYLRKFAFLCHKKLIFFYSERFLNPAWLSQKLFWYFLAF